MAKVNSIILERAKELQKDFTEEGYVPPIEDCIEMAIEENIYEKSVW